MLLKFLEDISIMEWILYSIIIVGAITFIIFNILDTIRTNKIKKNKEKNKK